jgi:thymidylate synthase
MKQYLDLLRDCYENGKVKDNRTGMRTKYLFGTSIRCDLQNGFPLLTTKKVQFKAAVAEMVGFFKGATTVEEFRALGCPVWDEWGLSRSVFSVITREQQALAEDLADKLDISVEEALNKLQEQAAAYGDYHATMDELVLNGTTKEIGGVLVNEELNNFMTQNKEPLSLNDYLAQYDISTRERKYFGKEGDLGPIYGKQWIKWATPDGREINQLKQVVDQLRNNPNDRRIILSGWNPADISDNSTKEMVDGVEIVTSKDRCDANVLEGKMALPPCHLMIIFDVDTSGERRLLNGLLIMRSNDLPLGCPFNIAGYAMMMHALAKKCDLAVGDFQLTCANSHIYENQFEGVEEQLKRTPTKLPKFTFPDGVDITDPDSLTKESVDLIVAGLENYNHQGVIKFPISV